MKNTQELINNSCFVLFLIVMCHYYVKQSTTPTALSLGIFIFHTPPLALLSSSLQVHKIERNFDTYYIMQP